MVLRSSSGCRLLFPVPRAGGDESAGPIGGVQRQRTSGELTMYSLNNVMAMLKEKSGRMVASVFYYLLIHASL